METPPPAEEITSLPLVERQCWRCRKLIEASLQICPHCRARTDRSEIAATLEPSQNSSSIEHILVRMFACYGAMLVSNLLYGYLLMAADDETSETFPLMLLIEIVTACLAIWGWNETRVLPAASVSTWSRIAAWMFAPPMLAVALAFNIAYHQFLIHFFELSAREEIYGGMNSLTAAIIFVCITPALFEELFFRQAAWKPLSKLMGPHLTVVVTSVMFGMAHIGAPLSIPALMIVGVALGYARLMTGGLLLPMLLHFLHNLVIILLPDL